jgi:cytochrome c oxidase assembly protein subunit 17
MFFFSFFQMGQTISSPKLNSDEGKPKCKPCCACPETRDARDKCVFTMGEENCKSLIIAHQECMKKMGFNIEPGKI